MVTIIQIKQKKQDILITNLGSPRKNGNTATVLKLFEKLISGFHEVELIHIARKNLKDCIGCEGCQRILDKPGCVQKDDFNEIIEKVLDSDIIVYVSPVYVWDFSAQVKMLIDRHCCLVKWMKNDGMKFLMEGKQTVLLTTCGGDAANNADLIQEIFKREMDYLRSKILGQYVVSQCPSTLPVELGDKALPTAQQMYDDFIK